MTSDILEAARRTAYPKDGTLEQKLAYLLRYAVLAPSSHNSQPWLFFVVGNAVEVRADLRHWLHVADPDRRELFLSLGCALENLLVAAEHFGFGHEVAFHADADRHGHAATVTLLAEGAPSTCRPAELFEAIEARSTHRENYDPRPVPAGALGELRECSVDEGVSLFLWDTAEVKERVRDLVKQADERLFRDPRWRRELAAFIGEGAFGDRPLKARLSQLALSHLDLGASMARHDAEAVMSAPIVGALCSQLDDRQSQVRVGQAFERLALLATNRGLALQPLSQIMEVEELREAVRGLLPDPALVPQHAFRLGYGARPERHSPRRPVEEALASNHP